VAFLLAQIHLLSGEETRLQALSVSLFTAHAKKLKRHDEPVKTQFLPAAASYDAAATHSGWMTEHREFWPKRFLPLMRGDQKNYLTFHRELLSCAQKTPGYEIFRISLCRKMKFHVNSQKGSIDACFATSRHNLFVEYIGVEINSILVYIAFLTACMHALLLQKLHGLSV
jgi:hypothetical protein